MKKEPNQITAHNAGWRLPPSPRLWRTGQFRFAGSVFWSGVCEFGRIVRNHSQIGVLNSIYPVLVNHISGK
jgi:hypothetical protein